jgi:hypothetical protein
LFRISAASLSELRAREVTQAQAEASEARNANAALLYRAQRAEEQATQQQSMALASRAEAERLAAEAARVGAELETLRATPPAASVPTPEPQQQQHLAKTESSKPEVKSVRIVSRTRHPDGRMASADTVVHFVDGTSGKLRIAVRERDPNGRINVSDVYPLDGA